MSYHPVSKYPGGAIIPFQLIKFRLVVKFYNAHELLFSPQFLPAAKPRRSMDGIWLSGKIESLEAVRGRRDMGT